LTTVTPAKGRQPPGALGAALEAGVVVDPALSLREQRVLRARAVQHLRTKPLQHVPAPREHLAPVLLSEVAHEPRAKRQIHDPPAHAVERDDGVAGRRRDVWSGGRAQRLVHLRAHALPPLLDNLRAARRGAGASAPAAGSGGTPAGTRRRERRRAGSSGGRGSRGLRTYLGLLRTKLDPAAQRGLHSARARLRGGRRQLPLARALGAIHARARARAALLEAGEELVDEGQRGVARRGEVEPARGTRRVRLVRGEGRGVSG